MQWSNTARAYWLSVSYATTLFADVGEDASADTVRPALARPPSFVLSRNQHVGRSTPLNSTNPYSVQRDSNCFPALTCAVSVSSFFAARARTMKIQQRPGLAHGIARHFAQRRSSSGCMYRNTAASVRDSVRIGAGTAARSVDAILVMVPARHRCDHYLLAFTARNRHAPGFATITSRSQFDLALTMSRHASTASD